MNVIGPTLTTVSILLNIWTVLVYFVFPYTDYLIVNYKVENKGSMVVHYILAAIYFILLFMTIWSYLAARFSEPGYVPPDAKEYNKGWIPTRERSLWEYIQLHG